MPWRAAVVACWCACVLASVDEAPCAEAWTCPELRSGRRPLKSYPGNCSGLLGAFALPPTPEWSRRCAREFLALVASSGRGRSRACVNLAPAGTGTRTLKAALQRAGLGRCDATPSGGCYHHRHADFAVDDAFRRGAACAIMTVREPAARVESGFRTSVLRLLERGERPGVASASAANAAFRAGFDAGRARRRVGGYFHVPMVAHLAGLDEARAGGLHLVCTDGLSRDIDALGAKMGWPALRGGDIWAASQNLTADFTTHLDRDARDWVNRVAYKLDYAVYATTCQGWTVDAAVDELWPEDPG